MSEAVIIFILFAVGVLLLVAEIFIPSHGVLCVVGVGFLIAGIVKTHGHAGQTAGLVAGLTCLVFVPTAGFVALKYWKKTPIGRMIAPPNPEVRASDSSVPVEEITALIGQTGRAITPLRPVGICMFGGRRVSCVAQFGMIDANVEVQGVGMTGSNLAVVDVSAHA